MREIPLTQGKVALVDDDDYERVNQWKWLCSRWHEKFYAARQSWNNGKPIWIRMHRFILSVKSPDQVDHIDNDGLNNQKANLRICSQSENLWNRRAPRSNKSGFKGVHWHHKEQRYRSVIHVGRRCIYLGKYKDAKEAARAYNTAALKYHGAFAKLNEGV